MASRAKFISKGSGLPVQLVLRKPGPVYAALVAADWPEARTAYVVAGSHFGAYAFMQRDLADELDRTDLQALTAAVGGARARNMPVASIAVTFALEEPVQFAELTTDRPANMPEEVWALVVERLKSPEQAERDREGTKRSKFQKSFNARAAELLPSMTRQPSDPPIDQRQPLVHKIFRGNVLLKRGEQPVGRYYPTEHVLILVDEEERTSAIEYLKRIGEDPLQPLNGTRVASLRGQVNFLEGHYFVVFSEKTRHGQDYEYDPKIAVYDPSAREMLSVTPAWSGACRELLEAHGLRVEQEIQPAEARGAMFRAAGRLSWDRDILDPELVAKHAALLEQQRSIQIRKSARTSPPPTVATDLAAGLPSAIADAANWIVGNHPLIRPHEWDPESASWNHRMAVLNEKQLADLASAVDPISVPPVVAALAARAHRVSTPHAPLLAAMWSREFAPEWFSSLPWQDRELLDRGGHDHVQRSLEEMSERQMSQSAQPLMVRLLTSDHEVEYSDGLDDEYSSYTVMERAYPNVDLNRDLTQNDMARIWLAVAALAQNELVEAGDPFAPRTCLVCQRRFPAGMLQLDMITFTLSDKVCRLCANAAYYGWNPEFGPPDSVRSDAMLQALRELATDLGAVPTRAQLTAALDCADDDTLARQIFLRMVVSRQISIEALRDAEVLPDAYRPSRGVHSMANDGHECRSLFERQVDDFLSAHGIPHEVEPPYPRDDLLNNTGLRGDWLLADGTFVEAAGMTNAAYMAKLEIKREIAAKYGFNLVVLTIKDLTSLEARFTHWLEVETS